MRDACCVLRALENGHGTRNKQRQDERGNPQNDRTMVRQRESKHKTKRGELRAAWFSLPPQRDEDEERDKERVEIVRL